MTCKDKVAIVTGAAGNGMGRSIAAGPVPSIDSLDEAVEQCNHGPA